MVSDKDLLMQIERYKDIRRELDRNALAEQARARHAETMPFLIQALGFLWNWLMAVRCKLIERRAKMSAAPADSPCQSQDAAAAPSLL